MAYTDLSGSKLKRQLGAALNESVAAPVASFARRQLEKMGWTEGTGLGRNRDGMATHIRVRKREDEMGLGHEKRKVAEAADSWWSSSVGETLARLSRQNSAASEKSSKKEKKRSKKKRKKSGSSDDEAAEKSRSKKKRRREGKDKTVSSEEVKVYTDQELFVATGGARFGMRAQRRAEAKWARTESGSELWEREEEAKKRIEWNGLGEAKVLSVDGQTAEGEGAADGVIEEKKRSKSSGKAEARQAEKPALKNVTPTTSGDEGAGESLESTSDGEREQQDAAVGKDKERKKSKKKDKKKRKEKEKKSGDSESRSEDEKVRESPESALEEGKNAREKSKKEKKKRKKEKKKGSDASQKKSKKKEKTR